MDVKSYKKKLGLNIKHYRLLRGFTQASLGEKINLTETYISLIENGHKNISIETLYKFSQALNVDTSKLFIFED